MESRYFAIEWVKRESWNIASVFDSKDVHLVGDKVESKYGAFFSPVCECETLEKAEQVATAMNDVHRRATHQVIKERVDLIIRLLFPRYHYTELKKHGGDGGPIRHPEKAWWWNGARYDPRTDLDLQEDGSVIAEVNSYVGGGESDKYTVHIPAEWIAEEDPTEIVQAWCVKATEEKEEADHQRKVAEAQRQIQLGADKLKNLTKG